MKVGDIIRRRRGGRLSRRKHDTRIVVRLVPNLDVYETGRLDDPNTVLWVSRFEVMSGDWSIVGREEWRI